MPRRLPFSVNPFQDALSRRSRNKALPLIGYRVGLFSRRRLLTVCLNSGPPLQSGELTRFPLGGRE